MSNLIIDGNYKPGIGGVDSSTGKAANATIDHSTGGLDVNIVGGSSAGTQYTDGGTPPAHPVGNTIEFNNVGTWATVGTANPLPVSATLTLSNYANETGGNLAAIKADVDKIPSQGQALASASMPVVLTAIQVTALTPPTNTGYALDNSLSTIDTDLKSNITLHAGSNIIGKVGIDQTTPGTTNGVSLQLDTTSGWTPSYQSALSSTKVQIKGTAGKFGGYINLYNPNTAVTYIQVWNLASASVTVGTTAPTYVITLPGVAAASATGSDRNLEITMGVAMNTGITIAATTTASGSSAPANAIVGTFLYI